ncbi:MAG: nicotinate (nicotinamide) nucleotide adenylyltransferase, partial [Clostridia bacterium]|nr:nicotinate (nicotinamide) nucleotide adenylyltransferase [Clostridia bacterium]
MIFMKRVGVFGGSFDPVHKEHVNMLVAAMNAFSIDEFIVMPTFISPHKIGAKLCSAADRMEMAKIAFRNIRRVTVSDYEIKKEGISYTYSTLEHIKKELGDVELYFLVGTDMLTDFPTWRFPERILSVAKIIVTQRKGEDLAFALSLFYDRFSARPLVSPYVGDRASSTKIRARLILGLECDEYLDEGVLSYIEKNS